MSIGKLRMHFLLRWISRADSVEIDDLLDAAMAMRNICYPDWDMTYIALPKGKPEERRRILAQMTELLMREPAGTKDGG